MEERRDVKKCSKTDRIRERVLKASAQTSSYSLNLAQFLKDQVWKEYFLMKANRKKRGTKKGKQRKKEASKIETKKTGS